MALPVMLRKFSPLCERQNQLDAALPGIGKIGRTLSMLDWLKILIYAGDAMPALNNSERYAMPLTQIGTLRRQGRIIRPQPEEYQKRLWAF